MLCTYDQLGFETNVGYKLNYSFHRNIGRGILGIGVEAGAFSKRVGPTGSEQWNATTNWQNDPVVPPQLKKTVGDLGFGLWYESENIWGGISVSHLNGKMIDDGIVMERNIAHPMLYQMARHYFVTGGVNLFPASSWEIQPSFVVKSDATITTFDLDVTAMYNNNFWLGASYRFKDAICPMIGFQVIQRNGIFYNWTKAEDNQPKLSDDQKKHLGGILKIGFAYDYTTTQLKNYNNGTFELFVNYCMPIDWPVKHEGHGDVRIIDRPDQP
jgi:type IX secretion system PorP/SprF family membrane protein